VLKEAYGPWNAGTAVDRVHKPTGFIKVSMKAAHYHILFITTLLRAFRRACPEMPMLDSDEHEPEAFRPDAIAVLAVALEDTLRQLRLVDRNDPAATKVAKKIIELARRGERDPIRLREEAVASFCKDESRERALPS
jgi:hypothetical protein